MNSKHHQSDLDMSGTSIIRPRPPVVPTPMFSPTSRRDEGINHQNIEKIAKSARMPCSIKLSNFSDKFKPMGKASTGLTANGMMRYIPDGGGKDGICIPLTPDQAIDLKSKITAKKPNPNQPSGGESAEDLLSDAFDEAKDIAKQFSDEGINLKDMASNIINYLRAQATQIARNVMLYIRRMGGQIRIVIISASGAIMYALTVGKAYFSAVIAPLFASLGAMLIIVLKVVAIIAAVVLAAAAIGYLVKYFSEGSPYTVETELPDIVVDPLTNTFKLHVSTISGKAPNFPEDASSMLSYVSAFVENSQNTTILKKIMSRIATAWQHNPLCKNSQEFYGTVHDIAGVARLDLKRILHLFAISGVESVRAMDIYNLVQNPRINYVMLLALSNDLYHFIVAISRVFSLQRNIRDFLQILYDLAPAQVKKDRQSEFAAALRRVEVTNMFDFKQQVNDLGRKYNINNKSARNDSPSMAQMKKTSHDLFKKIESEIISYNMVRTKISNRKVNESVQEFIQLTIDQNVRFSAVDYGLFQKALTSMFALKTLGGKFRQFVISNFNDLSGTDEFGATEELYVIKWES